MKAVSLLSSADLKDMLSNLGGFFGRKPPQKGGPSFREQPSMPTIQRRDDPKKQSFSKVFRWRLPDGQTEAPATVEIVGSFTRWQKVALNRDSVVDAWHTTIHHIPGNRTHHYMLLVDGKPTYDKTCDGLAVPHGVEEEHFQMPTDKGPRVLMLFSQTK
jgi:hypothetical protein